jgi:hypothetical protein
MVYTLVGDSTSTTASYDIRVNDITSNYHSQELVGIGSSIFANRRTNSLFAVARSNRPGAGTLDIKNSENSRFVAQSQFVNRMGADSSNINNQNFNIVNTGTVTSITKLTIFCDRTDGIDTGSRIRLYKVNTGEA